MIRLKREAAPYEIDLGDGVAVTVKPLTYAVWRASAHASERRVLELAQEMGAVAAVGGRVIDIPDPLQREGFLGIRDQFGLQTLAQHAIVSWRGVLNEDGSPAPVTPQMVDAFIRDAVIHAQRFEARYLARITEMISEGEGSGAAQNGTSAAAPTTAGGAEKAMTHAPMGELAQTEIAALPV